MNAIFSFVRSMFNKEPEFHIEFYPLTNRYYVLVDGVYLHETTRGVWDKAIYGGIHAADGVASEEAARKVIEKYREQNYKVGVKTIRA